ncbi:MAG: TetR/AcrR family transcriptional regulator [Devosiaceae bacterium]|nr:TetR/AcrR family transcriptional regulator [Devosiaceae bacterium]
MAKKNTLNAGDWIKGGFRALTEHGPQGIRVEAIARELKVSKGSFYWHFKDVGALKEAMLKQWAAFGTLEVIDTVAGTRSGARAQLRALIAISVRQAREDYGGLLAEAAIRDWARYDKLASKSVKKVEARRVEFLKELFGQVGFDEAASASRASILYAGLIGLEHLDFVSLGDLEKDLFLLLDLVLIDPEGAALQ